MNIKQKNLMYASLAMFTILIAGFIASMQVNSSTNSIEGTEGLEAQKSHLTVVGEKQGLIVGESTIASIGRNGTIEVTQLSQSFYRSDSGIEHTPLFLTKRIDKSSPLLFTALDSNEKLNVTLNFYQPDSSGSGAEINYYRIELFNAYVNSIQYYKKDVMNPSSITYPDMEEISFVYSKIVVTHLIEDVSGQSTWP